ncbi:hypothetical protein H0H92_012047, partial [Tricholoma furcatifolium]
MNQLQQPIQATLYSDHLTTVKIAANTDTPPHVMARSPGRSLYRWLLNLVRRCNPPLATPSIISAPPPLPVSASPPQPISAPTPPPVPPIAPHHISNIPPQQNISDITTNTPYAHPPSANTPPQQNISDITTNTPYAHPPSTNTPPQQNISDFTTNTPYILPPSANPLPHPANTPYTHPQSTIISSHPHVLRPAPPLSSLHTTHIKAHTNIDSLATNINRLADHLATSSHTSIIPLPSAPLPTFYMDPFTLYSEYDGWIETPIQPFITGRLFHNSTSARISLTQPNALPDASRNVSILAVVWDVLKSRPNITFLSTVLLSVHSARTRRKH